MISFNKVIGKIGEVQIEADGLCLREDHSYVLVGKSGTGKTLLLRMLMGYLQPAEGEVQYRDSNIYGNHELRQKIGYMPQEIELYEALTGEEQLRFSSYIHGKENPQKIQALLKRFLIKEKSDELIGTYSNEIQKRVAMASVFAQDPEVLILDDPFAGLKSESIQIFVRCLQEYSNKKGRMLLFTIEEDLFRKLEKNMFYTDVIYLEKGKVRCVSQREK